MKRKPPREKVKRHYVLFLNGAPAFRVQTTSRYPEPGDRQEVIDWLAEDLHLPRGLVEAGLCELQAS